VAPFAESFPDAAVLLLLLLLGEADWLPSHVHCMQVRTPQGGRRVDTWFGGAESIFLPSASKSAEELNGKKNHLSRGSFAHSDGVVLCPVRVKNNPRLLSLFVKEVVRG